MRDDILSIPWVTSLELVGQEQKMVGKPQNVTAFVPNQNAAPNQLQSFASSVPAKVRREFASSPLFIATNFVSVLCHGSTQSASTTRS